MEFSRQNTGVGGCSLPQGIFPTQGSNPGLLQFRRTLYQLSHREAREHWTPETCPRTVTQWWREPHILRSGLSKFMVPGGGSRSVDSATP